MTTRGAGASTQQMQQAPQRAMYVVPHKGAVAYHNALAHHLGRSDLEVVSPAVFAGDGQRLRGRTLSAIILDHATELTDREFFTFDQMRTLCELRRGAA